MAFLSILPLHILLGQALALQIPHVLVPDLTMQRVLIQHGRNDFWFGFVFEKGIVLVTFCQLDTNQSHFGKGNLN